MNTDNPFSGGYVLSNGACPIGTSLWQLVYVLENDPIGTIGDTRTTSLELCQIL